MMLENILLFVKLKFQGLMVDPNNETLKNDLAKAESQLSPNATIPHQQPQDGGMPNMGMEK